MKTGKLIPYMTLEIDTWRGISFGAQHYYGHLYYYDEDGEYCKHEIKRTLTKEAADKLTKQKNVNVSPKWFRCYEAGQEVGEFDSKSEIREIALKIWKDLLPSAVLLFEGRDAVASPQEVIAADDPALMKKINDWYDECEMLGWFDGDNVKEVERISDEFWELMCEKK